MPKFKNEIAPDLSQPPSQQQPQLEKDRESLEEKIGKFEERIESLCKLLTRSSESRLYNKVNELQEELCQKRYELLVAQIHLSAVKSQLQLFEYNYRPNNLILQQQHNQPHYFHHLSKTGELSGLCPSGAELAAAPGSNAVNQPPIGYRNKWIKAFKSLKETPAPAYSGAGASGASLAGQQK